MQQSPRPLVVHIIHRLDYGGLENGLINLINRTSTMNETNGFRHAIISLTTASDIATRIESADVQIYTLDKPQGNHLGTFYRIWRLLRKLKPNIVHTRNLATLDCQYLALLAGVKRRVHSEHGWDSYDPDGTVSRYRLLRRVTSKIVDRYIVLSRQLEGWIINEVGIDADKVQRICNGVDTDRFRPGTPSEARECVRFGSVTRFSPIKDPLNLVSAFLLACESEPDMASELLMVGDGELLEAAEQRASQSRYADRVVFAGAQLDVLPWLQNFDVFVLGSRKEGISNTVLEAMACGTPVIASRVGGNPELVIEGSTGILVEPENPHALAAAMTSYLRQPSLIQSHGEAGRLRAVAEFSLAGMAEHYYCVYRSLVYASDCDHNGC